MTEQNDFELPHIDEVIAGCVPATDDGGEAPINQGPEKVQILLNIVRDEKVGFQGIELNEVVALQTQLDAYPYVRPTIVMKDAQGQTYLVRLNSMTVKVFSTMLGLDI